VSIPSPDPSQPIKPILSVFIGCVVGVTGCAEGAGDIDDTAGVVGCSTGAAGCGAGAAGCTVEAGAAGVVSDLAQDIIIGIVVIIKTRHITKMIDFLILLLLLMSSDCRLLDAIL
jgi:hypothetical protein